MLHQPYSLSKHPIHSSQKPENSLAQDDVLLTVGEVAKLLRVNASTIRRWIATGTLQAVALPGSGKRQSYRIRQQTLDTILQPPESEQNVIAFRPE